VCPWKRMGPFRYRDDRGGLRGLTPSDRAVMEEECLWIKGGVFTLLEVEGSTASPAYAPGE
jgi:hypothetical protein